MEDTLSFLQQTDGRGCEAEAAAALLSPHGSWSEASAKEGRLSNGESSKPKTGCNLSTGEAKVQTEMAEGAKHEGIKG